MKARIALNPAIKGNYSFVCIEAPLFLDVINRVGYTSVVSPSILRGLKGKTLIDLDGVIDVEKGTMIENALPIMIRPVIKSLMVSPKQPKQDEPVSFSYDVEFENGTVTESEVQWVGKANSYNSPGSKTVKLKVKDSRNLWSDEKILGFNVLAPDVAPIITSLTVLPANPKVGEAVTFNYQVKFENDMVTERDTNWVGKEEAYATDGQKTVTLKVKDSRNLWSEAKTITFTVDPAAVIPPEPEEEVQVVAEVVKTPKQKSTKKVVKTEVE